MKNKLEFIKTVIAMLLLGISVTSQAAINEQGVLNWDTSTNYITVDGSSDRYIEWGLTKLLTYQQTLDAIAYDNLHGGVLAGFQIANQTDAYQFFNRYTSSNYIDDANTNEYIEHVFLGATTRYQNGFFGDSNSNRIDTAFFLSNMDGTQTLHDVGVLKFGTDGPKLNYAQLSESLYQLKVTDEFSLGGSSEDHATGWLLVSATTPVPEPSTYAMMVLGLLSVVGIRRRQTQKKYN